MRLAVVGSRSIREYDLSPLIPQGVTEIISGGAMGVDRLAERYARQHSLKLTVFLPEYNRYGRRAPLLRDETIVRECDALLALWDGVSTGTMYTVKFARKMGKPVYVYTVKEKELEGQSSFW